MDLDVEARSAGRRQALMDGDIERLSTYLADDLRYVHANGLTHDRAAYLQFVRDKLRFLDVRLESPKVRRYGEVAVITGSLVQRVIRSGEAQPVTLSSFAIEVWELLGDWRLVDFQSTRSPG